MKSKKFLPKTHEKINKHIFRSDRQPVGSKSISNATFFVNIFKDRFGTFCECLELKTQRHGMSPGLGLENILERSPCLKGSMGNSDSAQ